ncbi:hypothetical protein HRR83_002934 [Exophiala dermatitidis]|uniref:3-phytase phyB n=2 Tax=Exophiala dermatitidis TaxID=5970 RepID=H6BXV9_EXODN|nr:3-phytase phyB [Exophiala dermatitidis NIH/UT8656]KAJ4506845.1 hypothetical protein HRR73_008060 [Exophiala dermatitidis]EHY57449.1 3-phytase phyB [Exophiala dermatitidis NIH/UT8656]KAJ4516671.1 hypothetical protein HRR75_003328 [Exophiala dermatitidis]KAJ4520638.1 hypothetical protein HRR74_003636 [Exophiala dermatitidis]KAJ4537720.1 hypothetical protein HRR76_005711 [Exophiala dermatitidis]
MYLKQDNDLPMPSSLSKPRSKSKSKMGFPASSPRRLSFAIFVVLATFLAVAFFKPTRFGGCDVSFLSKAGVCLATVWNLFYHLGGNGPWIPRADGVAYSDALLPEGCSVDQAHMLSRHAERYPTRNAGARHIELLERLQNPKVELKGPLSFLKSWEYFTDPADPSFENLTATGPYAGTLQAFNTGRTLRQRYDHLIPQDRPTRIWSCGASRDILTAEYFASGFFGPDWLSQGTAELEVIPEDEGRGGDTLTPGDTCYEYVTDGEYGHDHGYQKLEEWQRVFTRPIAKRLSQHAQGLDFSYLDVFNMMEMCGFEILARGSSPWCNIFTHEEWSHFEYARDLLHFYRAGPGNAYAGVMGTLWLDATRNLMMNDSSKDVYFSFVHDGDIVPVLATLQILNERDGAPKLPSHRIKADRRWKTSDVVPMGGRLIFERIACDAKSKGGQGAYFVRLFINDGLVKFPELPTVKNLKHAVRLKDFHDFIASRKELFGDFRQICNISEEAPDRITFLHQ